jgi:hypothetical protein
MKQSKKVVGGQVQLIMSISNFNFLNIIDI